MKKKYSLWIALTLLILSVCAKYNNDTNSFITNMEEIYYGVAMQSMSITGFTFIMNMGLNFSVLCIEMDFINTKYLMYNMISVRYRKKSNCFWHYLSGVLMVCLVLVVIFTFVNAAIFLLSHSKTFYLELLLLSGSFFITSMIWMCIICILFTFHVRYNIIFFEMILISVISPIINRFKIPVISSIVPFPIDILQNKYILLIKLFLLFVLLIIWNLRQKKFENI